MSQPGLESGRGDAPKGRVKLSPAEAAIFETFVVPRYLSRFGELALDMLAEGDEAQVVHLFCRTGYPDRALALKLPGLHLYGCDLSPHALELARAKAATMRGFVADYRVAETLPTALPGGAFSHALTLHPLANPEDRARVLRECARLLGPQGQVLLAMPMRGSFQELGDLLREYAIKFEADEVSRAVDTASALRPSVEMLSAELEDNGFDYVEVELRPTLLKFQSGRDFFEDPVVRLLLLPEFRLNLNLGDTERPFAYLREAIDRYWSDSSFELTVNVGCASGRRK
jgi:SAM-dependent methyltransferase